MIGWRLDTGSPFCSSPACYTASLLVLKTPAALFVCGWGGWCFVRGCYIRRFEIRISGPFLGGRVFHCSPFMKTYKGAELEALVRGERVCMNVGLLVWRLQAIGAAPAPPVPVPRCGQGGCMITLLPRSCHGMPRSGWVEKDLWSARWRTSSRGPIGMASMGTSFR